ncbi:hypothetical protein LVT70_01275 [Klebsiella pneumoniae]|nr:hypothetical protein [Klebsiella pneumoniae]
MNNLNNGDVLMNSGNVYNPDASYPGLNGIYDTLPTQEATVTPDQVKQAVQTHIMNKQGAEVLDTTQNVAPPQIQPKYQIFAQQYQAQQAQQGNLPFTAPTKLSTIEDMLFSALGSYAVMRLLGTHSSPSWGVALVAAGHALDQDNKMKDRYPALQRLLKQGYSYPAVMEWYETGKTASIEAEQKTLSAERDSAANRAEKRYEFDQTQAVNAEQNRRSNVIDQAKAVADGYKNGVGIQFNQGMNKTLGQAISYRESMDNTGARGQNGEVGAVQVKPKYFQQEAGYPAFNPNWDLPTQQRWAEGLTNYRMQKYGFTQNQAIAAYNAGVPTVQAAITKAHNSNGQHDWTYYIPGGAGYVGPETQDTNAYVQDITNLMQPFGFSASPIQGAGNSGQVTYMDTNGNQQTANVETDRNGAPKLYGSDKSGHYYMTTSGQHISYDSVSGSSNNKINIAGQTADTVAQDLNNKLGSLKYTGSGNYFGRGVASLHSLWNDDKSNTESAYKTLNKGMEANMADRAVASAGGSQVLKADMQAQVDSAGQLSVDNSDKANRQVLDNWMNILGRAEYNTWYYNQYGNYPSPEQSREGGKKFEGIIMHQYPNIATAFTSSSNGVNMNNLNSDTNVHHNANGNVVSSTGINFTK